MKLLDTRYLTLFPSIMKRKLGLSNFFSVTILYANSTVYTVMQDHSSTRTGISWKWLQQKWPQTNNLLGKIQFFLVYLVLFSLIHMMQFFWCLPQGQRALDFVLGNQGLIDKTLLFDIELLKIIPNWFQLKAHDVSTFRDWKYIEIGNCVYFMLLSW